MSELLSDPRLIGTLLLATVGGVIWIVKQITQITTRLENFATKAEVTALVTRDHFDKKVGELATKERVQDVQEGINKLPNVDYVDGQMAVILEKLSALSSLVAAKEKSVGEQIERLEHKTDELLSRLGAGKKASGQHY